MRWFRSKRCRHVLGQPTAGLSYGRCELKFTHSENDYLHQVGGTQWRTLLYYEDGGSTCDKFGSRAPGEEPEYNLIRTIGKWYSKDKYL